MSTQSACGYPSPEVRLIIQGYDEYEYFPNRTGIHLTEVPRRGDLIRGPDDMGEFYVWKVVWDFKGGFEGRPPVVLVYASTA